MRGIDGFFSEDEGRWYARFARALRGGVFVEVGSWKGRSTSFIGAVCNANGTRLVCGKAPIVFDDRPIGAIATFQETARIEKMEVAIRKKTYAQGHVAHFTFDQIIGASEAITDAIEVAKDYAKSPFSVLILGETGTGKEAFAQSIHNASRHADGPFVAINCAALPAQILESELFGYVGGAFTGASREGKPGLFEVAHNGTVFLDEIGEMDYANQGRLLRFLQEKTIRRLGSERNIPVNVRIVAATNQNLDELVAQKTFREDLFYRLHIYPVTLPPLRERMEDVPDLVKRFVARFAAEEGKRVRSVSADAMRLLSEYKWPGNVRQLENTVFRAVVLAGSDEIGVAEFPQIASQVPGYEQAAFSAEPVIASPSTQPAAPLIVAEDQPAALSRDHLELVDFHGHVRPMETLEADIIRFTIAHYRGRMTEVARRLGIGRSTLYRKLKELGLEAEAGGDHGDL